ncbi:3'-5' exonuclease [Dictyobacter arantiisoli]|uniref:Exonuclease domain-containing protein n=1 Tax=Dictyobacter arantiisoli TaxID=2014874 RepID=A0A5A5TJ76_9CHLR|nr:3'-5' exonuclease [Dictyobacter arantiisoli]GCF11392.1 hypothetical protein KDI_49560 [Dictyobacter arantiisoli]
MRNLGLEGSEKYQGNRFSNSESLFGTPKVDGMTIRHDYSVNQYEEGSENFITRKKGATQDFFRKRNKKTEADTQIHTPKVRHGRGKIDLLTASYRRWSHQQEVVHWLGEMGKTKNWVILDTETTGSRLFSEVIDVAVISAQGEVLFSSLVNPATEIEPIATSIHGLTRSHVKHAPRYPDIHQQLCAALGDATILGYNVCFDIRLLAQTALCYDLEFPYFNVACLMYSYAKVRRCQPETKRSAVCRLDIACQEMGVPLPQRHRAQADAYAAYALFKQLVKTYEDTFGSFE